MNFYVDYYMVDQSVEANVHNSIKQKVNKYVVTVWSSKR